MLRRVLLRTALVLGFLLVTAYAVPLDASTSNGGVCLNACTTDICSVHTIESLCSALCDSPSGMCGSNCANPSETRLVCTGNVQ
jgi:hypothetical protein